VCLGYFPSFSPPPSPNLFLPGILIPPRRKRDLRTSFPLNPVPVITSFFFFCHPMGSPACLVCPFPSFLRRVRKHYCCLSPLSSSSLFFFLSRWSSFLPNPFFDLFSRLSPHCWPTFLPAPRLFPGPPPFFVFSTPFTPPLPPSLPSVNWSCHWPVGPMRFPVLSFPIF